MAVRTEALPPGGAASWFTSRWVILLFSVVSMVASQAPRSQDGAQLVVEAGRKPNQPHHHPGVPAATAEAIDRGRARSPTLADPL